MEVSRAFGQKYIFFKSKKQYYTVQKIYKILEKS